MALTCSRGTRVRSSCCAVWSPWWPPHSSPGSSCCYGRCPRERCRSAGFVFLVLVIFGWAGSLIVALARGCGGALRLGDDAVVGWRWILIRLRGCGTLAREAAERGGNPPSDEIQVHVGGQPPVRAPDRCGAAASCSSACRCSGRSRPVRPVRPRASPGTLRRRSHLVGPCVDRSARGRRHQRRRRLRPTNPASWGFRGYRVAVPAWSTGRSSVAGSTLRRRGGRLGTAEAISAMHEIAALAQSLGVLLRVPPGGRALRRGTTPPTCSAGSPSSWPPARTRSTTCGPSRWSPPRSGGTPTRRLRCGHHRAVSPIRRSRRRTDGPPRR